MRAWAILLASALVGCDASTAKPTAPTNGSADGGRPPNTTPQSPDGGKQPATDGGGIVPVNDDESRVDGKTGQLFGHPASSFARVKKNDGSIVSVGVVFAYASFGEAPRPHDFADDLILEMPDVARDKTVLHHVRVNWMTGGHDPTVYADAHFDFHFFRESIQNVDAIECRADGTLPTADKLPPNYSTPDSCSDSQGFHSWPNEDLAGGAFVASLITGYWHGNVVFVEPMIPTTTLDKKQTFQIDVRHPSSAGGKPTLYPTHFVATWVPNTQQYVFEFDKFVPVNE